MSLEGIGSALDSVSEIKEIVEVPDASPKLPLPEIKEIEELPDSPLPKEGLKNPIGQIEGPKDAERIIGAETDKASSVLDFTQETLESAKAATGNSGLFEQEENELNSLKGELAAVSNNIPIKLSPAELPNERIETIVPSAEPKPETSQKGAVEIQGLEITGLTDKESAATERAANLVYYSGEKPHSLEEVKDLINQLEALNAKEFPDDPKFDNAIGVFAQESKYFQIRTPLVIENGARDLDTGKTTPIEIIASEAEQTSVVRPTPEQLQQAEKDMLQTTHGKINEMYFYLKDLEAVASGNLDPYLKMLPKERLMEFVRKSYFEESVASVAESKPEVVGGLALTWEDTIKLYEDEGVPAGAELIRATGRFEESETSKGDLIIGEHHLRLVNIPEFQQRFDADLASLNLGDFVIVEHPSNPRINSWSIPNGETRFMQQAESYPTQDNGIGLEVMDTGIESKWYAWEASQQETGLDRNGFFYATGLFNASQRFFSEGGIEGLLSDIQASAELTEEDKKASLLGIQKFMGILVDAPEHSKQGLIELERFRQLYLQLDSACREHAYQERIASIKSEHPDAKLLIVVGNDHREGIKETLENREFRTSLNPSSIREFQALVEEFK